MTQIIEHTGTIDKIENNLIQVLIIQETACSECHANGICTSIDKDKKMIEVECSDPIFKVGESVILFGQQSIGLQAVLLAFVLPFIVILITLIILNSIGANELISGAISIALLIPYYIILSLFNNKLKSKLKFNIRKVIQ